LLLSYTDP